MISLIGRVLWSVAPSACYLQFHLCYLGNFSFHSQVFPCLRCGRTMKGLHAWICLCQWSCLFVQCLTIQLVHSCAVRLDTREGFPSWLINSGMPMLNLSFGLPRHISASISTTCSGPITSSLMLYPDSGCFSAA